MSPILPPPPGDYNQAWMGSLIQQIRTYLSRAVSIYDPAPFISLKAPNGTVYRVSVGNTGTLTTTAVSSTNDRPPV